MLPNSEELTRLLADLDADISGETVPCPACKPDESGGYGGPCDTCLTMRWVPPLVAARWELAEERQRADDAVEHARDVIGHGKRFYEAIIKGLSPSFPADSRDLEWDVLPGTVAGIARERDAARKEAAELRARIDAALEILDDPSNFEVAICRANEALWGEK